MHFKTLTRDFLSLSQPSGLSVRQRRVQTIEAAFAIASSVPLQSVVGPRREGKWVIDFSRKVHEKSAFAGTKEQKTKAVRNALCEWCQFHQHFMSGKYNFKYHYSNSIMKKLSG